jgi:large subunit ribosomal protein L20
MKAASGFRGRRSRTFRRALDAVHKAWAHAYAGRKQKKRNMRRLWIVRVNAAARTCGLSYSRLIEGLGKAGIELDRKILAELAVADQGAFVKVAETARAAL